MQISTKFIFSAPFVYVEELGNAKIGLWIGRELSDNDRILANALNLFVHAGGVGIEFVEELPTEFFGFDDQPNAYGFEVGVLPTYNSH